MFFYRRDYILDRDFTRWCFFQGYKCDRTNHSNNDAIQGFVWFQDSITESPKNPNNINYVPHKNQSYIPEPDWFEKIIANPVIFKPKEEVRTNNIHIGPQAQDYRKDNLTDLILSSLFVI